MEKAREILKKYFGYDEFRQGQEEIIKKILSEHDVLAILPTGAGKSLCYQIPALIFKGTCIVVSPLISLMKDQADSLRQAGIECFVWNSAVSPAERDYQMKRVISGDCKIIYVAPERLENRFFLDFVARIEISMVAVDEAHCVSAWGHDFRKSYLNIDKFIATFEKRPVVSAFTATATEKVKADVAKLLLMNKPFIYTGGFDRNNLYLEIREENDRFTSILKYIKSRYKRSGIIYCLTRKDVDKLHFQLLEHGIKAERYHAGLEDSEREEAQNNFLYDRSAIIVATNAFGMGIDKSNVRFVIHCGMPRSIEHYYQELGRAGRDGELSECILLYSAKDIAIHKYMIEKGDPSRADEENAKLLLMINLVKERICIRNHILRYFGENPSQNCYKCVSCKSQIEETDITIEAQKILSSIKRMGKGAKLSQVAGVLLGEKTSQYDSLPTFGIMKGLPPETLDFIIKYLLETMHISEDDSLVFLEKKAWPVLKGLEPVFFRRFKHHKNKEEFLLYNEALLSSLEKLRWKVALAQRVPPYIIFSDSTLKEIAIKLPRESSELSAIHGMGESKVEKYSEQIFGLIDSYYEGLNLN